MNVTNTSFPVAPISASAPGSHKLSIAFDSQPELTVPLTSVRGLHNDPNEPREAAAPAMASVVEEIATPYSHWGINE